MISSPDLCVPEQAPLPFPPLRRQGLSSLQVNLGYRCNQSCSHCHVAAGPNRPESMESATLELIPAVLAARSLGCLDITGGAPELHPGFRTLVQRARALGVAVIDRCNLTILLEPGQEDLAAFLAAQQVQVVASLPCYLPQNVDRQRGAGVFARSIEALQRLNALGYGRRGSPLQLHLVFNPQGASLPPDQAALEADYRQQLGQTYGVEFHRLFALTNMPIQRFAASLRSEGRYDDYLQLLRSAHRSEHLEAVMCRSLISVDWQGYLHDCDFNQMLAFGLDPLALPERSSGRAHLRDLLTADPAGAPIRVGDHCWGCTAGSGSSCSGSLG
jgi:radical SAM/Cys-rich protein